MPASSSPSALSPSVAAEGSPSPAPPPTRSLLTRDGLFRALWIANLFSSLGGTMQDTATVWTMAALGASPLLVTLMGTAASLPFFFFALPAGAAADVLDRRRFLLAGQGWRLAVAVALALASWLGETTPLVLLAVTFAMALGATCTMPGWQALFPEVVGRADAPEALSLAAAATNVARGVAPALAGGLLAWCGGRVVFTLDAVLLAVTLVVLAGWRRAPRPQGLPTERFVGAMKAALRYVFHAPAVEAVLARNVAFVLCAIVPVALLPILVRKELALPAASFGALMTAFGGGGVLISVFVLPKICSRYSIDRVLMLVTLLAAAATLALAWTRNTIALGAALFVLGGAWMAALASLNIAAQLAVPDWVRGRASSVNLFLVQGTVAVGSLLAGVAAQRWGLHVTLELASLCLLASLALGWLLPLPQLARINLTASHHWPAFDLVTNLRPDDGPVLISVDYQITPASAPEFKVLMAALRLIRLRDGGMRWNLLEDLNELGHFREFFLVESWSEHLRQAERATMDDKEAERRVWAFHIATEPPVLRHFLVTKQVKLPRGGQ